MDSIPSIPCATSCSVRKRPRDGSQVNGSGDSPHLDAICHESETVNGEIAMIGASDETPNNPEKKSNVVDLTESSQDSVNSPQASGSENSQDIDIENIDSPAPNCCDSLSISNPMTDSAIVSAKDKSESVKLDVLNNLDHIEQQVEGLRLQALTLEEKKVHLLESLQKLQEGRELLCLSQCDREEIEVNANRIICRCLTIDVSILTPRTFGQEKALAEANRRLQTLGEQLQQSLHDGGKSREAGQAMLNACITNCSGPIDAKFQAVMLECTADDQKCIRKKLENLLSES